jgi:magnesium-transporting ATPase (P-type)
MGADASRWILLAQFAATFALVGLIWFVQVVHYPLFNRVGESSFPLYHADHSRLTTWVVAPLMVIELGTALALVWKRPDAIPDWAPWLGLALVAVVWLSTALVQVPRHDLLSNGFDETAYRALVLTNWLRTIAWSARGVLLFWMLSRLLR